MSLTALSKDIRFDNASKGFDPTEGGVGRYLLLAISEICEAQDELRNGNDFFSMYADGFAGVGLPYSVKADLSKFPLDVKPCGFFVEIADAIIRLLDVAGKFDINVDVLEDPAYVAKTATIDDWLLAVCGSIANAGGFTPKEADFEVNLCEALATLFLLCQDYDVHIMEIIQLKLAYNRTRPPKHGRKF